MLFFLAVFKRQISRVKDNEPATNVMLVGNKCDLVEKRTVPTQEGQDLAKAFGCQFSEASAKTRENIENIFIELIREVRRLNKEPATPEAPEQGGGLRNRRKMIKGIRDKFKPKDCSLF